MGIHFATCNRATALRFIQAIYPNRAIADTPESAGPLLDFIERDIVRIQDPMMYGDTIEVIPATHWHESHRAAIVAACQALVATRESVGG